MSSWHQQHEHATGVYNDECCIGDCCPGDLCYYSWDRRGCPHNPLYNRFVTVGSVKYGVRVGAVSPPPPGARYRSTAGSSHCHCYRYETTIATKIKKTKTEIELDRDRIGNGNWDRDKDRDKNKDKNKDKECCCNVVNLPWPRTAASASASVSRIPLLADKQQLSINNCGIFSSVNSANISNGYTGCSSLPPSEREQEQENEPNRNTDPNEVTASAASVDAVLRSYPSWSHQPQLGLRSCVATTDHLRLSSSSLSSPSQSPATTTIIPVTAPTLPLPSTVTAAVSSSSSSSASSSSAAAASSLSSATQLFLQRRRVLVRSRSDVDDTLHFKAAANETTTVFTSNSLIRQDTLDRLHRFRFGGNRTDVRAKKRSDDKSERLRELTDRLKSATHLSSSPSSSSSSSSHNTLQKHILQHQQQSSSPPLQNHHLHSVAAVLSSDELVTDPSFNPIPPPRTRHSQSSISTRTSTSSSFSPNTNIVISSLPSPPPVTNDITSAKLNLPKPEPQSATILSTQRTIPFRSASFSLVDFSSDGKYFRKRNNESNDKPTINIQSGDSLIRAALTLPRKKENKSSNLNLSPPKVLQSGNISNENAGTALNTEAVGKKGDHLERNNSIKKEDVTEHISDVLRSESLKQKRTSDTSGDNACSTEDRKRDRSRRRKGIYISQWPDQRASVILAYAQDQEIVSTLGEAVNALKEEANLTRNSTEEPTVTVSEDVNKRFNLENALGGCENDNTDEKDSCLGKSNVMKHFNRVDSFSEGETDQAERRPATPIPNTNLSREHISSSIVSPSDISDIENRLSAGTDSLSPNTPRRYSKRPIRGPYGQMLEAEMKRPDTNKIFSKQNFNNELKFLDDLTNSTISHRSSSPNMTGSMMSLTSGNSVTLNDTKSTVRIRGLSNQSFDDSHFKNNAMNLSANVSQVFPISSPNRKTCSDVSSSVPTTIRGFSDIDSGHRRLLTCHQRTTSSPSKLEEINLSNSSDRAASAEPSSDFLCDFLRTSSEQLTINTTNDAGSGSIQNDTRTHIVVELYETERSYVESLQVLVMKYLEPLKSAENSLLLDAALVDEIFYQVPTLLSFHQEFLEELKKRLEHWDIKQKIGDIFLELTKPAVVETYTSFINNWKRAKEVIKTTSQAKPAFARFLEAMAREHKGKLALDSLLIKPVQKFPKYELLIQRLIKHTDSSHPDYALLLEAQKEIHENLIRINCTEKETVEFEQQQQNLRELESLVEGLVNLVTIDRVYIRHDLVTMTTGQGTRKERALFLFSDLLIITSIKRRSGTIKKPTGNCSGSVTSALDANKYKLLMRISLDDLEIMKGKDENMRRIMLEIDNITEDISTLNQINELLWSLHCPRGQLEDIVRDMLISLNRQLTEQQNSDSQLSYLDLTLNTPNGVEHLSIVFSQPEKRASWEEAFNEAKQKLAISVDRRPSPEFLAPVPIRKTRAGLQFTCAAPTLTMTSNEVKDVWVCNSDGYVGQVCVLSLHPEPTVTSCNGVCNARILCVASVPAATNNNIRTGSRNALQITTEDDENRSTNIQLDSSSSSADEDDSEKEDFIENRVKSPLNRGKSIETASTDSSDDTDCQQPTMWLGTEDGCIHIYNCNDNIRIKKNKIKLQHGSSILCIIYLDNRVFVSMANGDITIYSRDQNGGWNTSSPLTVSVSTAMMPVNKMLPNSGKLWCSCNNSIKIFNIHSLTVEHTFQINGDQNKSITCMVMSGLGVWIALYNSALIKCFHSLTYDLLCEVNMASSVTKMLTSCDDIIRQHKAACLRVTSLLACKDLLWIGTSAGVLLTMPLPHITTSTTKVSIIPSITGVPHGHTGHVRFLTCIESPSTTTSAGNTASDQYNSKLLVISGGDGYEDFRSSNMSDVAGREDSTNHLLLWHV